MLFSTEIGAIIFQIILHIIPLLIYILLTKQHPKDVLPPVPLGMKNITCISIISFTLVLLVLFVNHGHINTIINGVNPSRLKCLGLAQFGFRLSLSA